jgi:phytoene desaturase
VHKKAIVIGSGVAGLAVAIRLATDGLAVQVFEKNAYAGGKLSHFIQDGYSFDAGPSLFTQPQNIEDLFTYAGEDIKKYFTYKSVPISCKYFWPNGKQVNAYTNAEKLCTELETQLGEPAKNIKQYLLRAGNLYNSIGTIFLNYSLHKSKTWLQRKIFTAIKNIKWPYLISTLHKYNTSKLQTPEAVQLFNRFATYNGSNPYKTPGMMSLIAHLELTEGTYYPYGGMISITNALVALAIKKGVEIKYNSPAEKIIVHQNKAVGVLVNGQQVMADIVVSNADVYTTYKYLLNNNYNAANVLKQERSCSGVIFYWGINKIFEQLQLHNIFFSNDYAKEFKTLFEQQSIYDDPTIYINITSKQESNQAPLGAENWFILINAPSNIGQNWEQLKTQLRKNIINKLNKILHTNIEEHIVTEAVLDPIQIEQRTGSYMGSLYGTSSNSTMAAFLRQANFSKQISGLYFCGGSVHPGGGIPLCFKSAAITAQLVKEKLC